MFLQEHFAKDGYRNPKSGLAPSKLLTTGGHRKKGHKFEDYLPLSF